MNAIVDFPVKPEARPYLDAFEGRVADTAPLLAGGYVLEIAPGVALEDPIEIIHLGSGAATGSFHTRSLVALGEGGRASVLEVYAGEGRYWRNDVVAIRLAERAELARTVI